MINFSASIKCEYCVIIDVSYNKNFNDTLIMSVLPWKSITIGTLFEENVDKSRTATFVDWAVVVVAIDVVDAIVVVTSMHS